MSTNTFGITSQFETFNFNKYNKFIIFLFKKKNLTKWNEFTMKRWFLNETTQQNHIQWTKRNVLSNH